MPLDASAATGAAPASRPRVRDALVVVHRLVGLAIAVFVAVAGITGALLAFYPELDRALNHDLLGVAPPAEGAVPLHPIELRDRVQAAMPPSAVVSYVPLDGAASPRPTSALVVSVEGHPSGHDEWFVDPYTATLRGSRRWGAFEGGTRGIMPFVYRLHYSLALGETGALLLGIVALLWTLDCFVGLYLTLPPRRALVGRERRTPGRWLRRWHASWIVHAGKQFTAIFTWHRASGLWLWAMLLVFAWSSVGFNLVQVYRPATALVLPFADDPRTRLPALEPPRTSPRLDWADAHARAQDVALATARAEGFRVLGENSLGYDASSGLYQYRFHSTLDVSSSRHANTRIWIDGDTGALHGVLRPTGAAGDTVTTWLWSLHWGSVSGGGWPLRAFVAICGVGVFALSVSGVWIWVARRRRRRTARTART
ncbi:MAG: PepSY-associated TM helix domain-containing protein [Kofleriaceae bacterium]|nr:PepSY-associated TM helix domain-containing protein [Kofleriaceae bacterium]